MPDLHAEFGPSSLKNYAFCAGWKNKDEESEASIDGTIKHRAAETGKRTVAHPKTGEPYELNDEQWADAEKCICYCDLVKKGADAFFHEERLEICGVTWGTADFIALHKGQTFAHLIDFKFGFLAVDDPKDNLQTQGYACGVFEYWTSVEAVKVHILMPRRNEILTHTFYRKDYPAMKLRVATAHARAEEFKRTGDWALCQPALKNCEHCGRKGACVPLLTWALPMVKKYDPLPIIQEVHSSQITNPGEQAAAYYEVAKILEEMGKAARKHLLELGMKEGGFKDRDGNVLYEVATKSGNRGVLDLEKFLGVMHERGLTESDVLAFSKISIGDCLDHLASLKAPKRGKGKYLAEVEAQLYASSAIEQGDPVLYLKKVKKSEAIEIEAEVVTR